MATTRTARSKIVKALVDKIKGINGTGPYVSNLYTNVLPKLVFWDEVNDFPTVCVHAGPEARENLPGNFAWGYLSVHIKVYVQDGDDPQAKLEDIFSDIEYVLDQNLQLEYAVGKQIADINIVAIVTDEGLLAPVGVGELTLQIRYQVK